MTPPWAAYPDRVTLLDSDLELEEWELLDSRVSAKLALVPRK